MLDGVLQCFLHQTEYGNAITPRMFKIYCLKKMGEINFINKIYCLSIAIDDKLKAFIEPNFKLELFLIINLMTNHRLRPSSPQSKDWTNRFGSWLVTSSRHKTNLTNFILELSMLFILIKTNNAFSIALSELKLHLSEFINSARISAQVSLSLMNF